MKKSDIKNGMHVITKNGIEYIVMSNVEANDQIVTPNTIMVRVNDYGWLSLDSYSDDLRHENDDVYDIETVYAPRYYREVLSSVHDNINFIKVWERPIPKSMTKEEIEAELGYEIEIVD